MGYSLFEYLVTHSLCRYDSKMPVQKRCQENTRHHQVSACGIWGLKPLENVEMQISDRVQHRLQNIIF